MSCDRRCFDPESEYFEFTDRIICPGADKAIKPARWLQAQFPEGEAFDPKP